MWAIIGILFCAGLIILIDVPPLRRKKLRKELWVFSILLLIGTGLGIAQAMQVDIPNPLDLIIYIYKPISDTISAMLK